MTERRLFVSAAAKSTKYGDNSDLASGMSAMRKKWVPQVDSCVNNMTITDMDDLCK